MNHLIAATRAAVSSRNWYAALTMALTIPDICASLEADDGRTNGNRYAAWWDTYMGKFYKHKIGGSAEETVFMRGGDCYALRCAFLHQGLDDVTAHHAAVALKKFHFVQPPNPSLTIHCNRFNESLNLQVSEFCREMCIAAEAWLEKEGKRTEVSERMANLMKINETGSLRL